MGEFAKRERGSARRFRAGMPAPARQAGGQAAGALFGAGPAFALAGPGPAANAPVQRQEEEEPLQKMAGPTGPEEEEEPPA